MVQTEILGPALCCIESQVYASYMMSDFLYTYPEFGGNRETEWWGLEAGSMLGMWCRGGGCTACPAVKSPSFSQRLPLYTRYGHGHTDIMICLHSKCLSDYCLLCTHIIITDWHTRWAKIHSVPPFSIICTCTPTGCHTTS